MLTNRWNRLIPYFEQDVHEFLGAADDIVVQRVRLERDREVLYTADVFLYSRSHRRRLVIQFIAIAKAGGQWVIELPAVFQGIGWYGERLVKDALVRALQEVQRRPELQSAPILALSFNVPSDVPSLTGAGENRVAPGFAWNELYVHSAKRYLFASEYAKGLQVLDLGCGSGYGAKLLARNAKHVVAADTDPFPLAYGQETYRDPRVTRVRIDPLGHGKRLPFGSSSFDAVVCLEVVEHVPVEDMEAFFCEIGRVLKTGAPAVLSTPNKIIYKNYPDPYHVSLMSLEEFRLLLESRFREVTLFGQLRSRGLPHTSLEFEIVREASVDNEVYVAVCRGYCGEERRIVLPPRTVWEPTKEVEAATLPSGAGEFLQVVVEKAGLDAKGSFPSGTRNAVAPPPWWVKLWQRLHAAEKGRVLLAHVVDWPRWNQIAGEGWQMCAPIQGVAGSVGRDSSGSPSARDQGAHLSEGIHVEVLPHGVCPANSVDSLVAFGNDWDSAPNALKMQGSFLVGTAVFPDNPEQWRASLERMFDATVHLVDPERESPWLLAFGWKGVKLPSIRRSVLMVAHQRALQMFGGGETQLLETLLHLRSEGVRADVSLSLRLPQEPYDLVHVFSLYHGEKLEAIRKLRKPVVTSTIFWDYSELRYVSSIIRSIFSEPDERAVSGLLDAWRTGKLHVEGFSREQSSEPPEMRAIQRAVLTRSHILLPNSSREARLLEHTFGRPLPSIRIVPNAVRPGIFLRATAEAFVERFHLRDFVLCAGRVEPNKNQLMLIWALRGTGLPLVLAGPEADHGYADLCRRWGGGNVHWVGELPQELLASAYAAARVHALPSWSETPGLANLEAALAGCALVVSNRGAETEYLGDHAYVCDPGNPESIRAAVLQAWQDTDPARREARRQYVLSRYTWQHTAKATAAAYEDALVASFSAETPEGSLGGNAGFRPGIVWEGSQFVHHSLALVNRELCLRLVHTGYEVSIVPYEPHQFGPEVDERFQRLADRFLAALSRPSDVHVRHQWPPDFTPPPEGHWVMIQPWEFGSLPRRWVEVMSSQVDEVWVPSSYVRDCYVRSGVPSERVHVIPNGVDPDRFRPDVPPMDLARFGESDKHFKFLFVGGTIWRKGIDVLLSAYARAFTSADDVCLIVKDMGGRSFYRGQTFEQEIRRLQTQPGAPAVLYLDQDLLPHELPGLYRACDCLVHPYRGEGFGLPIAEAMACGLPVIVTNYGAALDFCSEETAYLIPASERRLPERRIGEWKTVDYPWVAEPDVEELARLMRYVYDHQEEARAKGRRASNYIRANFTWEKAAQKVTERIEALRQRPILRLQHATTVGTEDRVGSDGKKMLLLAETRSVHFLLAPDWSDPEDTWLAALEQFVQEFGPTEDVGMLLRVDPEEVPDSDIVAQRLEEWARAKGLDSSDGHLVLLVNDRLSPQERHLVYDAAHVFIPTSRSEKGNERTSEARARGLLICEPNGASMRGAWKAALERRGSEAEAGTAAIHR